MSRIDSVYAIILVSPGFRCREVERQILQFLIQLDPLQSHELERISFL